MLLDHFKSSSRASEGQGHCSLFKGIMY